MFNNSNEDNAVKYLQIASHQFWAFTKNKIFQNEACKRFLQITVLMILQPASCLHPLHLQGLRVKGRSKAGLTGTVDKERDKAPNSISPFMWKLL